MRSSLEPILQEFTIKAQVESKERVVGGLLAYRCNAFGHIFFIRKVDVEAQPDLRYAVKGGRAAGQTRALRQLNGKANVTPLNVSKTK